MCAVCITMTPAQVLELLQSLERHYDMPSGNSKAISCTVMQLDDMSMWVLCDLLVLCVTTISSASELLYLNTVSDLGKPGTLLHRKTPGNAPTQNWVNPRVSAIDNGSPVD